MKKRIPVEELRVGMFVVDFHTAWTRHPFLANQKHLRRPEEIRRIRDAGITHVTIDIAPGTHPEEASRPGPAPHPIGQPTDVGTTLPTPVPDGDRSASMPPVSRVSFAEELGSARAIYDEARGVLQELFQSARLGRGLDGEAARRVVTELIESIFRNPDALSSLTHLKTRDDYTFRHSLNVAVLSVQLGRALGLVRRELLHLGLGAVLHDLGKVRVPEALLQKPGALTPEEFAVIKTHAAHGAQMILAAPSLPDAAAAVALNHHERQDGSGYPRGLRGIRIGKFGLISALADVYDAMTTNRPYREGTPPHVALREIYAGRDVLFHPLYVRRFIQCLGIYPVGTPVRLDDGVMALVIRQNPGQPLRPWVRLLGDAEGTVGARPEDVDLSAGTRAVQQAVDPAAVGGNLEQILCHPVRWRQNPVLSLVLGDHPPRAAGNRS
ncbi:MAG: HD-GYP domain-containing protein [Proteobacteria bacterium]|nr:HD-GYP domain-containing protein [Pseudomonadota bacterium]